MIARNLQRLEEPRKEVLLSSTRPGWQRTPSLLRFSGDVYADNGGLVRNPPTKYVHPSVGRTVELVGAFRHDSTCVWRWQCAER